MKFRLEKISSDASKTVFRIYDEGGVLRGSVSVPPSAESDLLAHWAGDGPSAKRKEPVAHMTEKLLASSKAQGPRPVNKKAILRGCS
jgi:hypothetical protein